MDKWIDSFVCAVHVALAICKKIYKKQLRMHTKLIKSILLLFLFHCVLCSGMKKNYLLKKKKNKYTQRMSYRAYGIFRTKPQEVFHFECAIFEGLCDALK